MTSHGPRGYRLEQRVDGVTLVHRDESGVCVGRVSQTDDGLWMADFGLGRFMTRFESHYEAIAAVCTYAQANPHLAL